MGSQRLRSASRRRAWRALGCVAGLSAATGGAVACEAIVGIEEVSVTGGAGGGAGVEDGGGCEDAGADRCPDDPPGDGSAD
jgi:hypothetical protein